MKPKRFIAALASLALCAALCPSFASASTLTTSGDVSTTAETGTETVYVLASITENYGKPKPDTKKFSYSKSGLITKMASTTYQTISGKKSSSTTKWTYGKQDGITKIANSSGAVKWVYKLNKKGVQTECTRTMKGGSVDKTVTKAKYKSGKIQSMTITAYYTTGGKQRHSTETQKFAYAKGRLAKLTQKNYSLSYGYDKQGNLLRKKAKGLSADVFINTYDPNGRLVTRAYKDSGSSTTFTYKYKAITVKSNQAAKVKRQQWALLNENLNFALGFGFNL